MCGLFFARIFFLASFLSCSLHTVYLCSSSSSSYGFFLQASPSRSFVRSFSQPISLAPLPHFKQSPTSPTHQSLLRLTPPPGGAPQGRARRAPNRQPLAGVRVRGPQPQHVAKADAEHVPEDPEGGEDDVELAGDELGPRDFLPVDGHLLWLGWVFGAGWGLWWGLVV